MGRRFHRARGAALLVGAGATVVIGLIAWAGARAIGAEVLRAAWAVPVAIAIHAVQLWLSTLAWRGLAARAGPGPGGWLLARWVRESVNCLLPVAQLGGNLVGIRLLAQRGLAMPTAAAVTALDIGVEAVTQGVFTLIGIAALPSAQPGAAWGWVALGVIALAAATGGAVLAQRAGLFRLLERAAAWLARMVPSLPPDVLGGLDGELRRRGRAPGALARAAALQLTAWVLGTVEVWAALAAMGEMRSAMAMLAIEAIGMAARSVGFAVPGGLGVQEGGFLLAGSLFGLPPDVSVALSMVKRARELVVGVAGLLAWQWAEGSRLLRRA